MDPTKDPIVSDDSPNKWDRLGYSFLIERLFDGRPDS
jgi:hypothetical protein